MTNQDRCEGARARSLVYVREAEMGFLRASPMRRDSLIESENE